MFDSTPPAHSYIHIVVKNTFFFQEFRMLDTEKGRQLELSTVDRLLEQDLRNNSAWNHRWFVIHSTLGPNESLPDEVRGGSVIGGAWSLTLSLTRREKSDVVYI